MIKGTIINLVPATLDDRHSVYKWCFHSETTKSHSGPPDYPAMFIPTFEEFCKNYYDDYFFTGSAPNAGAGFMIMLGEKPIGFISYSCFHLKQHIAELDIWMHREAYCGKGFGTDAIFSLANCLHKTLDIHTFIMRPSIKNTRAVLSYKKAEFEESTQTPNDYLLDEYVALYGDGDYGIGETALLIKRM